MSDIKAIKLISGEEFVAEIVEEGEDAVLINNPLLVVPKRGPQGDIVLGFAPYLSSMQGKISIRKVAIAILPAEVGTDVKNGYNQIFGTGLVVPDKQLITG